MKKTTQTAYRHILDKYIIPKLGNIQFAKVNTSKVTINI
ncbi:MULTISPECIES: hypothetical protein [Thermoanaerobacter]|nr:hypothetical protein [Thermoanaerobacter sp. CM-CNRG TB177]HBW59095.1 hypothetical protein [Thermoanaerobacter sp.]